MPCSELEGEVIEHITKLEKILYDLFLVNYMTHDSPIRNRSKLSYINKLLNPLGLHLARASGVQRAAKLNALKVETFTSLTFGMKAFINQRTLGLMRLLITEPKRLVESCELFADEISKRTYVEYVKSIINASLSFTPCTLLNIKCVNPMKMKLENCGIRELGPGRYLTLYDVRGLFKIENNESTMKEIFGFETYKDEIHGIVPKDNSLFVDAGAFAGEDIAWFALYASDFIAYAIEPSDRPFEILKYNLTNDQLVGSYLKKRNVRVEFVKKYITEESPIESLVNPNDLKSANEIVVKADIEGAERDLLRASKSFLRDYKPTLLLAAYHRGDDLVVLPNLIMEANDSYKLYLRPAMYRAWFTLYAK